MQEIAVAKIEYSAGNPCCWIIDQHIWHVVPIENALQWIIAECRQLYLDLQLSQAIIDFKGKKHLGTRLMERSEDPNCK